MDVLKPNELRLLALTEACEEALSALTHDPVASDLYLAVMVNRGLELPDEPGHEAVFSRWFIREAGVIPVAPRTFINISVKGKRTMARLERLGLLSRHSQTQELAFPHTFRLTPEGKKALDAGMPLIDAEKVRALTRCSSCGGPIRLQVDLEKVVDDRLGRHAYARLECAGEGCQRSQEVASVRYLAQEQAELLYMMGKFDQEGSAWISHNALRILIFEGILHSRKGVGSLFNAWSYAPYSVRFAEGRRYMNISQEAEDDLNDLREQGLIEELRMGGPQGQFQTKYQIAEEGRDLLLSMPEEVSARVDRFISCPSCGGSKLEMVCGLDRKDMEGDACLMRCTSEDCLAQRESTIMDIEDVDYVSVPYWFGCVDPVPSENCIPPSDAGRREGGW